MKDTLFTNWNFSRALRLIFGLIIAYQAINHKDPIAGFLAAFLLFQVYTNTGCCGSSCAIPSSKCNTPKE
jgi:hypothetical protein